LRSWTIKDGGNPSVGRSFFMKIPLRLLLIATVLTGCCSVVRRSLRTRPRPLFQPTKQRHTSTNGQLWKVSLRGCSPPRAVTRSSISAPPIRTRPLPAGSRRHHQSRSLPYCRTSKESTSKSQAESRSTGGSPKFASMLLSRLKIE
jgi:hypothetical protein